MVVMPGNSSGWFWHCLARETQKVGHLYSPGAQRGPWPWFPYALDNGCFALWNPDDNTFNEFGPGGWQLAGEYAWRTLLMWTECVEQKPLWAIVPDRPGSHHGTVLKWERYAPEILGRIPLAIAVQDGMKPEDVRQLAIQPEVICVGGSTEWKWATVEMWAKEFPRVHLLRCNAPTKLDWLEELGVESTDGTGWNRGDPKQTAGL